MSTSIRGKSFIHASKRKQHDVNFSDKREERKKHKSPRNNWISALFGLLAITALLIIVPAPASATTVGAWGATASTQLTGVQDTVSNSFDFSPSGLRELTTYDNYANPTHNCYIAISDDYGATWFPNKATGMTSTAAGSSYYNCNGRWLTDSSLVVSQSTAVRVSTNSGTSFSVKDFTDTGATDVGNSQGRYTCLGVYDETHWMVVGSRVVSGQIQFRNAYTADGGTTWTFANIANVNALNGAFCGGIQAISATSWVVRYTDFSGVIGIYYTSNAGASTTWTSQGSFDSSPSSLSSIFPGIWTDGTKICIPVTFNAANSLFGVNNGDAGMSCKVIATGALSFTLLVSGAATGETFTDGRLYSQNAFSNDKIFVLKQSGGSPNPQWIVVQNNGAAKSRIEQLDAGATAAPTIIVGADSTSTKLAVAMINSPSAITKTTVYTGNRLVDNTAPVQTVATTGLVGMDVDTTGQSVLIARTNGGTTIRTFSPGLLGELANDAGNSACNSNPSVNALPTHVAYTKCNPGSDVDQIWIRATDLTAPDFNGCDYCNSPIDETNSGINLPNNFYNLFTVSQYPYDFTGQDDNPSDSSCQIGGANTHTHFAIALFPFIELGTGQFGIYMVKWSDVGGLCTARSDTTTRITFTASGSTPDDMCSWRDSVSGRDFIALADSTVGIKVYTFDFDSGAATSARALVSGDLNIHVYQTAPSFLLKAEGLACAGNMISGETFDGKVGAYYVESDGTHTAGQTAWSGTASTTSGGITTSGAGYTAYLDGTTIKVVNATTGSVLRTLARPVGTGAFIELDMDRNANNVWLGEDAQISRYSIFTATTGTENLDNNPDPFDTDDNIPSSGTSTSTSISVSITTSSGGFVVDPNAPNNFFGIDISYISGQWGIPETGFRWLLGLFTTGLIVGAIVSGRQGGIALLLGGVGVLIASGVCVAFGLFPIWFLLLEILLVVVMTARLFFTNDASE